MQLSIEGGHKWKSHPINSQFYVCVLLSIPRTTICQWGMMTVDTTKRNRNGFTRRRRRAKHLAFVLQLVVRRRIFLCSVGRSRKVNEFSIKISLFNLKGRRRWCSVSILTRFKRRGERRWRSEQQQFRLSSFLILLLSTATQQSHHHHRPPPTRRAFDPSIQIKLWRTNYDETTKTCTKRVRPIN